MLNLSVSWGHVALLALANFLLSWAWYSPLLFAKPWMAELGLKGPEHMTEEDKKKMPLLFLNGALSSLFKVWALAVLILNFNIATFAAGASMGLLTWIGFSLTGSLDTLWEGRKPKVLAINNGLFAVSNVLFGAILAVWH